MKISLKWIHEFVDVQEYFLKPEVLAEILTRAGLEVEDIQNKAKDFANVVTGLILEKDKHPNADKLSLCKVMTSEGVVHQIVCGAQNHKKDDKVVVALPGAVLPTADGKGFAIKQSVIRGVDSAGMLCSLKELGLAKESEGIQILPAEAPIGKNFADYMGLDDVTMELKVTPNRADCLSHYGLAREIAALTGKTLLRQMDESAIHLPKEFCTELSTRERVQLEVKDTELCPRYCGRWIEGVKVGASPDWLKQRLELLGMNSINNVVDVTNYVMLELGQPLHAFDGSEIKTGKVVVGRAHANEKFVTLDGSELILTGEELMIQDLDRSMCMAGAIGGKNSGVSEATQNIFLESAFFTPATVRKSLRSHGLNTDSGYRFSRGVDPSMTRVGLERATELIVKVAGGKAYVGSYDVYPKPSVRQPIAIALQTISDRLGYAADEKLFKDFFTRLGCVVQEKGDSFLVTPPSFRFDIENEMDLVEEYARMNGYDHIPETIPALQEAPSAQEALFVTGQSLAEVLAGEGWSEAKNFAFTSEAQEKKFLGDSDRLQKLNLSFGDNSLKLLNPLNEELNRMRASLSFGLFKNLVYNYHQGNLSGRLFELGECFSLRTTPSGTDQAEYQQNWNLGFVGWGHVEGLWSASTSSAASAGLGSVLVYELKTSVEVMLRKLKIKGWQWQAVVDRGDVPSFIHRGQCLFLKVAGQVVGYIGTLHPVLADENKLRCECVLAEFNLESILKTRSLTVKIKTPSKQPKMTRDLALVMPKSLRSQEVEKEIRAQAGGNLIALQVFDVFEPKISAAASTSGLTAVASVGEDKTYGLEKGQKSVAYRLVFQNEKETLQESEVQSRVEAVLKSLEAKFQIRVR